MNHLPKVIFRMVAHNSEKTIARAMDSVLGQTYANLELHVGIRASTDGTLGIVNEYAQRDPRVRAIVNKQAFVYDEGNNITDYYHEYDTEKDFVCFIDGDDEYKPDFLEKMVPFAAEHNLDIACCGCFYTDAETKQVIDTLRSDNTLIIEGDGFGKHFTSYYDYMRTRWGKICRLSVVGRLDLSRILPIFYSDDTVETIEYFRNSGRIGIYPQAFYVWYKSSKSLSYKWNRERIEADRIVFDFAAAYLRDKAGGISLRNMDYIMHIYLFALNATAGLLLEAQIPAEEKLEDLYDILTSRHARLVTAFPTKFHAQRENLLRGVVAGWINAHMREFNSGNHDKMIKEIIAVADMLPGSISESDIIAWNVLCGENAGRILEISGNDGRYGRWLNNSFLFMLPDKDVCAAGSNSPAPAPELYIDRVDLSGSGVIKEGTYRNVYGPEILADTGALGRYDVIVVFHLLENTAADTAKEILKALTEKASKQVLVLTPEYPYDLDCDDEDKLSEVRAYHPVFFSGMEFSYKMFETPEGKMQAYSFFPKVPYEPVPCDEPAARGNAYAPAPYDGGKKLKIAYILCNHSDASGTKAILRQMKILAGRGHTISAYCRRGSAPGAVPEWSGLSDDDAPRQVIIPENADFLEYTGNEDVIIISRPQMAADFEYSKVPVVLYEQGAPLLSGIHGDLIGSNSRMREAIHGLYRKPVRLFAVSHIVRQILEEVYSRKSLLFPPDIDTGAYYPDDNKNNEVPVILFIGSPLKEQNGFGYARKVLGAAKSMGLSFKVQIVSEADFELLSELPFDYEIIIGPPQEKLREIYRNADILLLPPLYEPFPMPPLEAMASGTAVIAMDCGGIHEYAKPGVNCLLCEQGDTLSMLYALQYLLENPGVRGQLGQAGRETALRFSYEKIAPVWEECLYDAANSPQWPGAGG